MSLTPRSVARHVECAVERHAHGPRKIHQFNRSLDVDVSVWSEESKHDPVRSQRFRGSNIAGLPSDWITSVRWVGYVLKDSDPGRSGGQAAQR